MAQLKVNLEQGNGLFIAHAADFLGCFAKASSQSDVIDRILKDVTIYSEWLLSRDISNEYKEKASYFLKGINKFEIIEEHTDIENLDKQETAGALFKSDQETISEEQFEQYISLIKCLPDLLLKMVFPLPSEALDLVVIEKEPTINEILIEIYNIELIYFSKFGPQVEEKFFEAIELTKDELESLSILERIVKVQQGVIAILRSYYPKQTKTFNFAELPNEKWTIKKVIRKIIEFQREYIEKIRILIDEYEINHPIEESE